MVDNQHKLIEGYRDLSKEEIAQMNEWKEIEKELKLMMISIRGLPETNQRHVSIAETHIETGIMYAIKAIARPA